MDANRNLQRRIGEMMFSLAEAEAVIEQQKAEIDGLRAAMAQHAPNDHADPSSGAQQMLEERGG